MEILDKDFIHTSKYFHKIQIFDYYPLIYFILALTYKIARREIIKIKNTILLTYLLQFKKQLLLILHNPRLRINNIHVQTDKQFQNFSQMKLYPSNSPK